MKRFFLTTALAAIMALPAAADMHAASKDAGAETDLTGTDAPLHAGFLATPEANSLEASDLIGARVYVAEDMGVDAPVVDIVETWDDVGEVNDILISQDGGIEAILVDIGGFLGIGEKTVAVSISSLDIVSGMDGDWFVAFPGSRSALEAAPRFMPEPMQDAGLLPDNADAPFVGDMGAAADAVAESMGASGVDGVPENKTTQPELTADRLEGAPVYDREDERVGTVTELVLDEDGRIDAGVVEIGGLLGMIGGKPVLVDFEEMEITQDAQSTAVTVTVDKARGELEKMPEYKG